MRRFLKIEYLDLHYKQELAFCQSKNWIRVYEEIEAVNQVRAIDRSHLVDCLNASYNTEVTQP